LLNWKYRLIKTLGTEKQKALSYTVPALLHFAGPILHYIAGPILHCALSYIV